MSTRWERGTKSLDIVIEESRIERAAQLHHFDALDAKAGIILGFSGVLVAIAPSRHLIGDVGRLFSVVAAVVSLLAFRPRGFPVMDLYTLRQRYLSADPRFTKLVLMDTRLEMLEATADLLREKATKLKVAMLALVASVLLVAVGISLH